MRNRSWRYKASGPKRTAELRGDLWVCWVTEKAGDTLVGATPSEELAIHFVRSGETEYLDQLTTNPLRSQADMG